MSWQEIIISVVSVILTALASWGTKVLVDWMNSKIKDTKLKTILNESINTITSVVQATYQTYVQTLKEKGEFTAEVQKIALENAVTVAKSQLSKEVIDYLTKNGTDITEWIKTQIESIIYELKNQNKTTN